MVQAILFDLFETLITESETRPVGASSLGVRLGLDPDAFREQWARRRPAVLVGQLSFVAALSDIGATLGAPVDPALLEVLRRERIAAKAVPLERIEVAVCGVLKALRARGIRIGVVSNCVAEDVATWRTSQLARLVDGAVFSFAVRLAKPNPEMYREAARQIGVVPAAAVFVGDGADDELVGATQAGCRAFRALWYIARWSRGQSGIGSDTSLRTVEDVMRLVA